MLFEWKTSSWACLFCSSLSHVSGDLSSLMELFSSLCPISVAGNHCLIPCHFWMLSPWEFASADSRVHSDDVWTVWQQELDFQSPLPVQIWLIAFLTKCFQKYLECRHVKEQWTWSVYNVWNLYVLSFESEAAPRAPCHSLTQHRFPWGRACLGLPSPVTLVFTPLCSLAGPSAWLLHLLVFICPSEAESECFVRPLHWPLEPSLPPLNVLKSTPLDISLGLSLFSISSRLSQEPSSQAPFEPHHFINEKPQNTLFSS